MSQIVMTLLRTVFLPVGSPPIGSVISISLDLTKADVHGEGEEVYCLGEIDMLIDYNCFSPEVGKHVLPEQNMYYPKGRGKEWQALLNLPFALNEKGSLPQGCKYEVELGVLKWYMVTPRALELELPLIIKGSDALDSPAGEVIKKSKKDGGWQMVDLDEIEREMDRLEQEMIVDSSKTELDAPVNDELTIEATGQLEVVDDDLAPQIVKIVFNDNNVPDDSAIKEAIAQSQAEAMIEQKAAEVSKNELAMSAMAQNIEEEKKSLNNQQVDTPMVVVMPEAQEITPQKPKRSYGIPHLVVDAQNNNVDFTAFKINIKLS